MGTGIDRARDDVSAGELWRARDRLRGVLQNDPANQQALDLLGEVYWQMGDFPQAGRFWCLTERADERAAEAWRAFERSRPELRDRLRSVPARKPVAAYPPAVRDRLAELQAQATRAGVEWEPGEALRRPRGPRDPGAGGYGWRGEAIAIALLAVVVGVWVVGFATVLAFLISLIF
jgi:hypothetical protein